MYRNFKTVDNVIFGKGCFSQFEEILAIKRTTPDSFIAFLIDDVFTNSDFRGKIPFYDNDILIWVNVDKEPKTSLVDSLTLEIQSKSKNLPSGIVGIGGGSIMDIAKAVSLMFTNPGSSSEYQGLDLIKNPGIYCVVVPTLSGTGAEVSMTTVLTGPEKKLGIKCDYTVPNQIILDPELIKDAPNPQRFYTGMDCYIHNIESLNGTWRNPFSDAFAKQSLSLCRDVFLNKEILKEEADEKLMIASYFGGLSLTYSQVGVCHALSYGLSYVMGLRHGLANCLAFNQLIEYYPEGVEEFWIMQEKNEIELPKNLVAEISEDKLDLMIRVAYDLDHMWDHAFGKNWKEILTLEKLRELFLKI